MNLKVCVISPPIFHDLIFAIILVLSQQLSFQTSFLTGGCFKRVSPPDAISAYDGAINIWLENGRTNMAAKLMKEIAEMQESEPGSIVDAIESFQKAADCE